MNKSFKDILNEEAEKSIEESYANYGGTNVGGTSQSSTKNKYTPATILKAAPLRHHNPDVPMGQSNFKTKAPANMIYPFEGIFAELVEIYVRTESVYRTLDSAKDMATLSDAKKVVVTGAVDELDRMHKRLRKIIGDIEEVTI